MFFSKLRASRASVCVGLRSRETETRRVIRFSNFSDFSPARLRYATVYARRSSQYTTLHTISEPRIRLVYEIALSRGPSLSIQASYGLQYSTAYDYKPRIQASYGRLRASLLIYDYELGASYTSS